MKIKLSWIFFIPFSLAILALNIVQVVVLTKDNTFMGLGKIGAVYACAALAFVLLIICKVLGAIDNKTSKIYIGKQNKITGILAGILAIALAAMGAKQLIDMLVPESLTWFTFANGILSIIAAVAFIIIAVSNISGKNLTDGFSGLILFPSIWCLVNIIHSFINYTTKSVSSTDMTDLIIYVFAALFLYWHATVLAKIPAKNSIKSSYAFGMPAAALSIGYSVKTFMYISRGVVKPSIYDYLYTTIFLVLGIYIIVTLIEYSLNVKTLEEDKELIEQYILGSDAKNEEDFSEYGEDLSYIDDVYMEKEETLRQPASRQSVNYGTNDEYTGNYNETTLEENDQKVDEILETIQTEQEETEAHLETNYEENIEDIEDIEEEESFVQQEEVIEKPRDSKEESEAKRLKEIDKLISEIEDDI